MLKLGVIGTSWISKQLVEAAQATKKWTVTSVYSRSLERAKEFGEPLGIEGFFDDLESFFSKGNFEVVYIASPNSLHFKQAKMAIEHDKNVIVEKPAFTKPKQYDEIAELLDTHDCHFIEAARHIHTKIFRKLTDEVKKLPQVDGAYLNVRQYSSRMHTLTPGQKPANVFKPEFAGGALMDIGVYGVYVAVSLFGMPNACSYTPVLHKNEIDVSGNALLKYDNFFVNIDIAKNTMTYQGSEIYGSKEVVGIDSILDMHKVAYYDAEGKKHASRIKVPDNPLYEEMNEFADLFINPDEKLFDYWVLSAQVGEVLNTLRQSAGIKFPDD
ncbi:Gfo/Idh/MocA family oxidoreductase [Lactobacillus jensenii]|jgi:oxidoreductase domain protein|uniref:Gfo/Idh/MocA family oxidoreductase n=1 Tax=Lactobacillus jensenii TaxID=109790 RepID=A0A5N1I4B7_LACJE|nr:Gfo/Idh/MocA family oxidoreductase [Lactobacillus jensenii]APT15110.1 oxidoreductase [Lactobacillus jensenii]EEQ25108.1 oxidoreductase, NAD-binding domain protein [Lactobacillus jensenii 269-3]EEX26768.1 oxidoreductase, NAD-binding domain protein [Lactobacillus jensenii SJ-7A-US]KAA9235733.1 Gfo/Idh/MocA family oxidoreductase [Lactobacillus jensenii]KAA9258187.1 Gfo/Idh/MocA family oxidoreductase [Lactobacillus jensenii]